MWVKMFLGVVGEQRGMHGTLSSWSEIAFFACGRFKERVVTPGWDGKD